MTEWQNELHLSLRLQVKNIGLRTPMFYIAYGNLALHVMMAANAHS